MLSNLQELQLHVSVEIDAGTAIAVAEHADQWHNSSRDICASTFAGVEQTQINGTMRDIDEIESIGVDTQISGTIPREISC